MTATSATFDSFGILEHILSFVTVKDLLAATAVSRRFKTAGRSNTLWKDACRALWKDRNGISEWREAVSTSLNVRYSIRASPV